MYTNKNNGQTYNLKVNVNLLPPTYATPTSAYATSMTFVSGTNPNYTLNLTSPTQFKYWGASLQSQIAGVLHQDTVYDPPGVAPPGTAPGQWGYVQILDGYTASEVFAGGVHSLGPISSPDSMVPSTFPCLFPYPPNKTGGWTPSGQSMTFTDSPGVQLRFLMTGATLQSGFHVYLYYQPPSSGTPTVWVPLAKYDWSVPLWTATAPASAGANWAAAGTSATGPSNLTASPAFPTWLAPPTQVKAAPVSGGGGNVVSWTAPPEVTLLTGCTFTYNLLSSTTRGGPYSPVSGATGLASSITTYTDGSAVVGATFYVVTITCTAPSATSATSGYSNEAPSQPPGAPTMLPPVITATQITFSWSAVPGATSYAIATSSTSGGPYPNSFKVYGTSLTVPLSQIKSGTYYDVVLATYDNIAGPISNEIKVVIP